ncbi:MAG TPA: SIMPL domain-containing protein [Steroidobacteraceae bacterium]|nr:SIMPL domain-containing protein [Steroidobacteraceae bacterium]
MTIPVARVRFMLGTLLLLSPALPAQTGPEGVPRIMVSDTGEATAPAARATLTIGIDVPGSTAAAAEAESARVSAAVIAALHRAGLPPSDLQSTHVSINPQWVYDERTRQQQRTGFRADSTVRVSTAGLDRLGAWVDAALGAGATTVSDPAFAPADEAALRHQALEQAVRSARGDAEVVARAAGGSLGALLQIDSGQGVVRPMSVAVTAALRSPATPTHIVPDEIHVTATVTGVWRYIAGPATTGR